MQQFIDKVIPFILAQQEPDGSFPTWESYPVVNPAAGWTKLPDPSPFITANILFGLLQVNDDRLKEVIAKGAKSLWRSKEGAGFWRFWPVKSKQHPLPLDMDDTCIVSAVLERCGYHINNRNVLLANQNNTGRFETWLRPRASQMLTAPVITYSFFKDYLLARPTYKLKYFSYKDYEPAIEANALLYLGENEATKASINSVINEIEVSSIPKKYYDDEVVVYYHIARAFVNAVPGFKRLGAITSDRINIRFGKNTDGESDLMKAMAANILLDFNQHIGLAEKLISAIAETNFNNQWKVDAYFCSNDKNFLAGSPALTAAVFIEACAKLNQYKPA